MSQTLIVIVVVLILISLWYQLHRDYIQGLAYGVFLCVLLPTQLRIELPGSLPQLTIYRLILISLFFFWLRNRSIRTSTGSPPLLPILGLWCLANLISLVFTQADFVDSLKRFLDRALEVYAFYYLISKSLRTSDDARRVLRAILRALVLVAMLGVYEHQTGFNPIAAYLGGGASGGPYGGIESTFQHRILLGAALAMGLPLAFALMYWEERPPRTSHLVYLWLAIALLASACYFTNSRGPWLALGLVLAGLGFLGSRRLKKTVILIGCFSVLALLMKPGVWASISSRASQTKDASSLKGGNFYYRLELWKVAWVEINKSPERLFFGYGPGSGANRNIDWQLSYRGTTEEIWSWDNHWAYELFQSGLFGFAVTLGLYWSIVKARFRSWRTGHPPGRDLHLCILASAGAMCFMMTNVLIFSKQLDYLFWSVVAAGYVLEVRQLAGATEVPQPNGHLVDEYGRRVAAASSGQ